MRTVNNSLVECLVGRRGVLFTLCLLLTLGLAAGIPRTAFDTSLGVLLTRSDPYLAERDRMSEAFPTPVEISFAFLPASGTVFERDTLLALADLNREFRQIPRALSMNSLLAWQSPYGDQVLFPRALTADTPFNEQMLAQARERVMDDPFLAAYVSPAGDLALAGIRLRVNSLETGEGATLVSQVNALRDSLRARYPSVTIHVSSEAHYEQSNRDAMLNDLQYLLPLVLLLCTAVICYSFRSVLLGASILGVALMTVVMTVGALAWAGWSFNTISVMAPLVVVTIAVADSVHIISLFRQHLQAGESPVAAMRSSLRLNLRPITLATLTTVTGFASLNLASSPAISSFGTVVAIGVGFAYWLTLALLPALVLMLPVTRFARWQASGSVPIITATLTGCQALVHRHGRAVLWSVTVLGAVCFGLSFRNTTDFDRSAFISDDSPLHDYYTEVSARMEQGTQLRYGIEVTSPFGLITPAFLQRLDAFSAQVRAVPNVTNVASLVEVIKTVNQIVNDNAPDAFAIPATDALIEDALFNYTVAQVSDFSLDTFANDDFTLMNFYVFTNTRNNQGLLDISEQINTLFAAEFPDARLLHGSNTLLFARMDEAVTLELLQGYGASLLLITLTLVIGMRSLTYGLLSMLPNLLPAVLVFGVWGLLVGRIDPFVMMLFSISIGLVVDDTVHVLSTYQSGREEGLAPDAAVARALTRAGPALLITTAVLAVGTCVLIAASTLYFQQAATLLVPIVVVALLLDLSYFPAILLRFDHRVMRLSARA